MRGRRLIALVVAIAMTSMAVPAAADVSAGSHTGVLEATAFVGKRGVCLNSGLGYAKEGGLGYLAEPRAPAKAAWFSIRDGRLVDAPNGLGTLELCGRVAAPLRGVTELDPTQFGVGATCVAHKGWGGYGTMRFESKPGTKWLSNLNWKTSVGGTMLWTADAGGHKGKKADLFVAVAQFVTEVVVLGCLFKDLGDKSAAGVFSAVAAYEIVANSTGWVPPKDPKDGY